MKNLENYGVLEMNANEIKETNGGFIWIELWGGINFVNMSGQLGGDGITYES
ncbi:hypothetical protein [Lutibacter sp.]|uniref:hypothetical protein n=1 Tax=Lutibacter sp. TaxID=1925666 RepID=UPI0025C61F0D|nr:hypothetical protein [Lutibacter sp.]MCF6181251.1 hypothetical protein [Lutibacter sp.]